jgi:hypothetical protein
MDCKISDEYMRMANYIISLGFELLRRDTWGLRRLDFSATESVHLVIFSASYLGRLNGSGASRRLPTVS